MQTTAALWLCIVLFGTVAAQQRSLIGNNNYICSLTLQIFRFELDTDTGLYVFKEENQVNNNFLAIAPPADSEEWIERLHGRQFLHLRNLQQATFSRPQLEGEEDYDEDPSSVFEEPSETQTLEPFLDVRVCWCTEYAARDYEFCPIEFNTCLVPQMETENVKCFTSQPVDTLVRSFWPALVFWCAATAYALICSEPGLYARQFLGRCCCCLCCGAWWCGRASEQPNTNSTVVASAVAYNNRRTLQIVERMLEDNPQRAAGLFRQHLVARYRQRRRRQQWWWKVWAKVAGRRSGGSGLGSDAGGDEDARDTLVLKTKIYKESEHGATNNSSIEEAEDVDDDDMENGDAQTSLPQCAICLLELEDGDVIGDIPCGHLLHKECLKDWLVRKNKCPLCQQPGIARLEVHNSNSSVVQRLTRQAAAESAETSDDSNGEAETTI